MSFFRFTLLSVMVCGALLLAGCSDDVVTDEPINPELVQSELGIFNGIRVRQWNISDGNLEIPLYTTDKVKIEKIEAAIEDKLPKLDCSFKVKEGMPYLIIKAPKLDNVNLPLTFTLTARGASGTKSDDPEPLTVVCRSGKRGSQHDDLYNYDCIRDSWGCGMSAADEIGGTNIKARIFDYDELYNYIESQDFSGHDGTTYTMSYELSGSDYEETTRQYAFNMGINGNRKLNSKFELFNDKSFQGSFDMALQFDSHAAEYYEYNVMITKARRKSLKLPAFMDYSPEKLVGYLSEQANDVLNNPSSAEYKTYPNTKEGIYALFDRYGTHAMTSCVWGGRFLIVYFRKQNAYQNSTASSFDVSVGIKKVNSQISSDHPLGTWIIQQKTKSGISMDVGFDSYAQDIQQTTKEHMFVKSIGGNASTDPESWLNSMDPANAPEFALIALGEPTSEGGTQSGGLITLSCLSLDTNRRAALERYINQYILDRSHSPASKPGMILADVYMLKDSDNGDGGVDGTQQRVMTDAFGVKRLYTPMYVNKYGWNSDIHGHAVETSNDNYITCSDECDQYWYVALDWPSECNGIADICFADKDDYDLDDDGWVIRGARADSEMNWSSIDNNYLCVKYIREGDTSTKRITGFGLAYSDEKNDITKAKLTKNKIFCSSVGTEMRFPFATDVNFDYYWTKFSYSNYTHRSWWGSCSGGTKYRHFYPVYTHTPIRERLTPDKFSLPRGKGW